MIIVTRKCRQTPLLGESIMSQILNVALGSPIYSSLLFPPFRSQGIIPDYDISLFGRFGKRVRYRLR
jgi:hypothetical protein